MHLWHQMHGCAREAGQGSNTGQPRCACALTARSQSKAAEAAEDWLASEFDSLTVEEINQKARTLRAM